jgi:hypothetical protein
MNPFKRSLQVWLLLLIGLNAVNWQDGGPNAASRFAAIQSMAEDRTFKINPYKSWTDDWAQPPSGEIYSNKAPGPMFLAVPVAWVLNRIKVITYGDKAWFTYPDGMRKLTKPGIAYDTLISWIFQIIPFSVLMFLLVAWLQSVGTSYAAVNFIVVALLFGNTMSIFLNMYFGHPISGIALLASLLCINRKKYLAAGFLFGLSMLSDYGTVFVAIPFLIAALMLGHEKKMKVLGRLMLGGLLPAIIFAWYHTICFGKPWSLPMQFQNPLFVETATDRLRFWGIAAPIPDWRIFLRLCFGNQRGILYTQPWVWVSLICVACLAWRKKLDLDLKAGLVFSFGGLFGLLWMNAGFNGWHGGGTAGPRYLSIIFPCLGLMTGLMYDRLSPVFQKALWLTLGYSVFFRIAIYCTTPTPDWQVPLWTYSYDFFFGGPRFVIRVLTLCLTSGGFTWATLSVWKAKITTF